MKTLEFRTRPVIRHIVTSYDPGTPTSSGGSQLIGEFDSEEMADVVRQALIDQSAPREYVAVLSTFESKTEAMYFESEEAARDFQSLQPGTWRIFSREVPPQH